MDKRKRSFLWDQILKGVQVPNSLVLQVRNLIDSGNKRHFLGKKITKKILIKKNQIIYITYSNCIVFNLHSLAIINRQRNRSRSCVVGNFCILFSHAISSTFEKYLDVYIHFFSNGTSTLHYTILQIHVLLFYNLITANLKFFSNY